MNDWFPFVSAPPRRILIADEQPLVIWALERTLAPGVRTVKALSGEDACRRLRDGSLAAAILACRIGDADMSDVIAEIDHLRPDLRLVVLCRSGCAEQLQARLAHGVVFDSPFDIHAIARAASLDGRSGPASLTTGAARSETFP